MEEPRPIHIRPLPLRLYLSLLMAGWVCAVVLAALWDLHQRNRHILENSIHWARACCEKDTLYRQWIAGVGGVYVPVSDMVQPNPHLFHIPERDLCAPSGQLLTLLNSAYMTRLIYEFAGQVSQGHISSLKPVNPQNVPDSWESLALHAFEKGQTEVSTVVKTEEKSFLRLMRPIVVQEGCLNCHAAQGYKIGDIRGGISVTIPIPESNQVFMEYSINYVLMGLMGLLGLVTVARRMKENITQREQAEEALCIAKDELDARVQEQTAELKLLVHKLKREVVERRRVETNLAQMRHRYELILYSTEEGIFGLDLEGKAAFINPAAARMTGYEPEELLGRHLHEIIHHTLPDGTPHLPQDCSIRAVLRDGQIHSAFDNIFWSKENTSFPVEFVASPVRENGEIVGAVVVFRDISERKQLEEQLLQAQKMEAVGRLAGGVAHDFNNILGVIMGYAELLMMSLDGNDLLYQAQEVKKAADRAAALTRQLLAFSRKQILQPRIINLNSVIADIEKMLQRLIGEDIDINTVPDPHLANIKADPGQIEQVIMNLAVNARDAMPEGGKITIETANVSLTEDYANRHIDVASGDYVILAVSDSGIGMDAETQAHIFEPFFTTKQVGKGTGLGLAMVYGIVKQSGGHISVHSEPGRGTMFKIYLPQVTESSEPLKAEVPPQTSSQGRETILVVEDDEALRQMVCEILRIQGYTILKADNEEEALLDAQRHQGPIHLLLTDVVMPKMGGREMAERLSPLHPEMKVLYMSGYTEDAISHHGVLDQDTQLILKPFTPFDLAQKVREVLDTSRTGDGGPKTGDGGRKTGDRTANTISPVLSPPSPVSRPPSISRPPSPVL